MKNNQLHSDFKLNGNSFSTSEELIAFSEGKSQRLHNDFFAWIGLLRQISYRSANFWLYRETKNHRAQKRIYGEFGFGHWSFF